MERAVNRFRPIQGYSICVYVNRPIKAAGLSKLTHLDVPPLAGDEERGASVLGHGAHLLPLREVALLQPEPQARGQLRGRGRRPNLEKKTHIISIEAA